MKKKKILVNEKSFASSGFISLYVGNYFFPWATFKVFLFVFDLQFVISLDLFLFCFYLVYFISLKIHDAYSC